MAPVQLFAPSWPSFSWSGGGAVQEDESSLVGKQRVGYERRLKIAKSFKSF